MTTIFEKARFRSGQYELAYEIHGDSGVPYQGRFMEVCRKVFGKRLMYKELIGEVLPATT